MKKIEERAYTRGFAVGLSRDKVDKTKIAEHLNVSRRAVHKWIKNIMKGKK